jgi:peptidoglycan/LPS O-acetylase OafA/YrhL
MYACLALILFFISLIPLLILDGQTFRNTLIASGLALASALIAFLGVRNQRLSNKERRVCRLIVLGSVGLALVLATRFPRNYEFQKSFNEKREPLR